jgi:hypothetical protein
MTERESHDDPAVESDYEVHRVDDNGNEFVVAQKLSLAEAEQMAEMYEARAHKQMYMVRRARQ